MKQAWALIRSELWQRRWALMWWSIAIVAFIVLNLAFYPSFKDQAGELDKALSNMPDSLKALFTDTGDFTSPVGYLSSQIYYLLLPALLTVYSIGIGASLLAKEEQQGTLELLLARPLSRTKLLISKLIAGLLGLLFLGTIALIVSVISVHLVGLEVSRLAVAVTTLDAMLLAGLFGAIAFMFSALGRPARLASIGIASLVAFGGYIISSLDQTVTVLTWPAKLLPYHYYTPAEILRGTTSGKWQMLGFLIASLLLFVIAWIGFRRRDIG